MSNATIETPPSNIYIPPGVKSLKTKKFRTRLGIQGFPSGGKTCSAFTFPNLIVLDFDNNLNSHTGKDIPIIEFWNPEFINSELKVPNDCEKKIIKADRAPNRRDALKRWLREHGPKFTEEQTLFIDSWTRVVEAFDKQTDYEPSYTNDGKIDKFAPWRQKIKYSEEVFEMLEGLKCNVIVAFHETVDRDDDNRIIGIKPLMSGQFADKIPSYFTDYFRMVNEYEDDKKQKVKGYFWQIRTGNNFKARCSAKLAELYPNTNYVPADYSQTFARISSS